MPVIGRISVGDGATFTPAIDSDGVLSFSNNKNLPNPEPFDIPGAVVNSGAMAPGSENGTIAFGGNDVAVTGWDTKANVASPAFTGTPTAPTPTSTDDSTKLATTSFVQSAKTSAVTSANNYTDEQIRQHGNLPVGHEYFSMNPNVPQGSLPLIGGVYSRETYADLWAWVQTQSGYLKTEAEWQTLSTANNGNVPFYSSGDGSTTFRVPSLHCWIKGSDGSAQLVGSYLQAGLPNITGHWQEFFGGLNGNPQAYNGAFYLKSTTTGSVGSNQNESKGEIAGFDASRSSSIYGNANTVQPESIVGMWLVKAYGTIVDTGQIDEQAYIDDRFNASKQYTDTKVNAVNNKFAGLTFHTWSGLLSTDGAGRINIYPSFAPQELIDMIPLTYDCVNAGEEYTAMFVASINQGQTTFTALPPYVINSDHWIITIADDSNLGHFVGNINITFTWATAIK